MVDKNAGIQYVAPFAGAWIEITSSEEEKAEKKTSLPSRERGLK